MWINSLLAGLLAPGASGMAGHVRVRFESRMGFGDHFHVSQRSPPDEASLQKAKTDGRSQHRGEGLAGGEPRPGMTWLW